MGGLGSGRYGTGRKPATCEALRVDLFYLARHSMLIPGRVSQLNWTCRQLPSTGIHILALDDRVVLLFRARIANQKWETRTQSIAFVTVRTNFGHRRLFRCPSCNRACRDLYGRRMRFSCRKCLGLAYISQYQSCWERALDQRKALRKKVDALADTDGPLLKPPRMRWRTYRKLLARNRALGERCTRGIMSSVGRIERRVGRANKLVRRMKRGGTS